MEKKIYFNIMIILHDLTYDFHIKLIKELYNYILINHYKNFKELIIVLHQLFSYLNVSCH